MPSFDEVLKQAEKRARQAGLEAEAVKLLLLHDAGLSPTELYRDFHKEMPKEAEAKFQKDVSTYLDQKKPVQYIIGEVWFYGYAFDVDEDVLIPRFETEELVANILSLYDDIFAGKKVKLVDVGTGSGCLAVSLKKEEPNLEVVATDISRKALDVAARNARKLAADVTFLEGDMLEPLEGMTFDILVSNPPYIPQNETVDEIIVKNEPHVALFGGEDGLKFYDIIFAGAPKLMNRPSFLAFEHGYDKKEAIQAMAKRAFPDAEVFTLKDLQGRDRMTFVLNH